MCRRNENISAQSINKIYQLKKKFNTLLILDEIATGFGRAGTIFAFHQAKVKPDSMYRERSYWRNY